MVILKYDGVFIFGLFFIAIITLGAVCASDNVTDESVSVEDNDFDLSVNNESNELTLETDENDNELELGEKTEKLADSGAIDIYGGGNYIYGYNLNEQNSPFGVLLPDYKSGLSITVDDEKYDSGKIDPSSAFDIDTSKLSLGNHKIKVVYSNGKTQKTFSKTIKVAANIMSYNKYAEDWYIGSGGINAGGGVRIGDGTRVSLKLPSNADGNLSVYLSTKNENLEVPEKLYKSVKLSGGYAFVKLDNLNHGKYYYLIKYTGSDYSVKTQIGQFVVYRGLSYPFSMKYGQNKYLSIVSDKSDSSLLTVKVNGKTYGKIQMVNGSGKISLKRLPVGSEVSIKIYEGSKLVYFDEDGMEFYVNVDPLTKLTGMKNIRMYYMDGTKCSVKVYGIHGKPVGSGKTVTFKIGSKTYKVKTNAKSIAKLKIKRIPGTYKISASFKGVKVVKKLTVKQVLKLNKVKVRKSAKKLILKATLKKAKKPLRAKKVTFKFHGKKYVAKTNKKGIAKVKIKKSVLKRLKVGKKITYSATYVKSTVKKSARVRK